MARVVARIGLHIEDAALRLTIKAMLEAEGHKAVEDSADLVIAEDPRAAIRASRERPALVLTTASGIGQAVKAMSQGVYGYLFVPLQPHEAGLMIQRALAVKADSTDAPEPEFLTLEAVERAHIESVLRHCKHNQAKAAKVLGVGRNTLWRKLKRWKNE